MIIKKEQGQVVILLLLIMVVALAIGLSTIGRSILEVSTSRRSEDSSRAFSAAEAGIEQAIKQNENNLGGAIIGGGSITLPSNLAGATVQGNSIPLATHTLNFSTVTKRDFAQFWLADPINIDVASYNQPTFDIYFGDPNPPIGYFSRPDLNIDDSANPFNDQPAIEVSIIYWDNTDEKYKAIRKNYDSRKNQSGASQPRSNFNVCPNYNATATIDNSDGTTQTKQYYCRVTVPPSTDTPNTLPNTGGNILEIVRVRLLYTNTAHDIALQPVVGFSLPKQANIYQSSGTSGEVRRTLEVTNYRSVMPQFFDYVLFSARDLSKQ